MCVYCRFKTSFLPGAKDDLRSRLRATPRLGFIVIFPVTPAFLEIGNPSPYPTNKQNTSKHNTPKGANNLKQNAGHRKIMKL